MEERVIKRLAEIVGPASVLESEEERLCHSYDATRRSALPDVVVRPQSTEQVAAVARLCTEEKIPLTPRGAGTGLSGGSVPVERGIVMSLTRMNRVREMAIEDLYAICEAGVVTQDFQKTAEEVSLFYPPDPASQNCCTIGGNVATAAGGMRCLKYGVTKNYLMGLEAVLPTGETIKTGARTVKSVVGFDLTRLMCGSEGTLAVVTAAILRLIPKPEHAETILAGFDGVEQAAAASAAVTAGGLTPAALELMDALSVSAVLRDASSQGLLAGEVGRAFGGAREGALLLAETDGFKEAAEHEAAAVEAVLKKAGARFVKRSSDGAEREALWEARRGVLAGLAKLKPITILEDATVPRSRIVEMVRAVGAVAARHGLTVAVFGHAGDGNLHPTILVDAPLEGRARDVRAAVSEMFDAALALGGTVSGEHGIGIDKAPFLRSEVGEAAFEIMRQLKKVFDPEGILNPGKLLV
ncbi:MAG: FAD-binding protein [Candidatus Eisenbacteria bacterium]|nr:FAD-binding protein [Candidatus Eisenbacteria bacterium]